VVATAGICTSAAVAHTDSGQRLLNGGYASGAGGTNDVDTAGNGVGSGAGGRCSLLTGWNVIPGGSPRVVDVPNIISQPI